MNALAVHPLRARTRRARGRAPLVVLPALVIALLLAAALPGWASTTNLEVRGTQVYTPTGVTVHAGDQVHVVGSGKVNFGGGRIAALKPPGVKWGPACQAIAAAKRYRNPWPAKGLSCWSLIGRVGEGAPFYIGNELTFRAATDGQLVLGVNDNFVGDNSGSWTATVDVTPAAAPAGGSTKSSSKTGLFIVIGGVVVLAVLLLLLLAARRRKKDDDDEPAPVPAPEPAVVPAAPAEAEVAAAPPEPEVVVTAVPAMVNAPAVPESIDVNIFEVEFTNGLTLRVGYNHFPDNTLLNWRVTQSRLPKAVGSFVTKGGGSTNHFETVPLGVKLEGKDTHPDGADVQFDWSIDGVPFRYSVRRDPNC